MKEEKKERRGALDYVFVMQRLVIILAIVAAFFPAFSPSRVTKLIDGTISLFTSGVSYSSLTDGASRALRMGWVDESVFVIVFTVYPIFLATFRKADLPGKYIPACIMSSSCTFALSLLPGGAQLNNIIPVQYLGTTPAAAAGIGLLCCGYGIYIRIFFLGI